MKTEKKSIQGLLIAGVVSLATVIAFDYFKKKNRDQSDEPLEMHSQSGDYEVRNTPSDGGTRPKGRTRNRRFIMRRKDIL